MADRRQALEARLDDLAREFSGKLALFVKDVASGETIARDEDAVVPTASCIKLFVLMELLRRVAAGDFTLEQKIPVLAEQQVGGSGVLKDLSPGIELPL